MTEQFNTDASALTRRIEANRRFGKNDLNAWIISHVDLAPGLHVLDVGSGSGNQTIPVARLVAPRGTVTAVDISGGALESLRTAANAAGVAESVRTIEGALDELEGRLETGYYARVISCYAVYYSHNPEAVFRVLYRAMAGNGIFFFCGPALDNNRELREFHRLITKESAELPNRQSAFMEIEGLRLAQRIFASTKVLEFRNTLQFNSASALHQYWSSYYLYEDQLNAAFVDAANEWFTKHSVFETTKRAIGILAVK